MKAFIRSSLLQGILILQLVAVTASADDGTRGGGDTVALDFVKTARMVHQQLVARYPDDAPKIDLRLFQEAIEKVRVESTSEVLTLNGARKDAINDPSAGLIQVNRAGWLSISVRKRKALALHEYLRFMKVEDGNYEVSAQISASLEEDPLVQLSDALSDVHLRALTMVQQVGASPRTMTCYSLAGLNQAVTEAADLYSTWGGRVFDSKKVLRIEMARLERWPDPLRRFCTGVRRIHSGGFAYKANDLNLRIYLMLVQRDSEMLMAGIGNELGQNPPESLTGIWSKYGEILSGLGEMKVAK